MDDGLNELKEKSHRIRSHMRTFEAQFLPRKPHKEQAELWDEIKSGINQIIEAAEAPYFSKKLKLPVILIATPEIVYLPPNMGALANAITTGDGGGLSDISAALVAELDKQGVNVHVTLPEYQNLFKDLARITNREYAILRSRMKDRSRIYPITDDIFKIAHKVYDDQTADLDNINLRRANAFMRGVISRLLPNLKADHKHILVHCNDWMTGLIPAAAKSLGIRSLMTFHNVFTTHQKPSGLRKHSIDIRPFYKHLIFGEEPGSKFRYYKTMVKADEHIDFMTSGLYAADFINTVSPTFLKEMVNGYYKEHHIMSEFMREIIIRRDEEKCAKGILNAPMSHADPRKDPHIPQKYGFLAEPDKNIADIMAGKAENKAVFQRDMGLIENTAAPIFYWPSRIASPQKGFELVLEILPELMKKYHDSGLQIAVVANGEPGLVRQIVEMQERHPGRVCYHPFSRALSQRGMAGSDFVLMPSLYEPCGTPQVVGQLYGTPPIVRKTGGLADTVKHLSQNGIDGSGFVFEDYDSGGFQFAIAEAMRFYRMPEPFRTKVLQRIMKEAADKFSIETTAKRYIDLYEEIFRRAGYQLRIV